MLAGVLVPPEAPGTWERHAGAACAPLRGYRRREPEKTLLHRVVRERLETFLAAVREAQRPRPRPARLRRARAARLRRLWSSGTRLRAISLPRLWFRAAGRVLLHAPGVSMERGAIYPSALECGQGRPRAHLPKTVTRAARRSRSRSWDLRRVATAITPPLPPTLAGVPDRRAHLSLRQMRPGPSAMVTQVCPSGQAARASRHGISQEVNLGPRAPAMP